ncbi:hypothetical protein BZJ17_15850 [Salinivibrio sp. IB574]|uniref:phage/plasmid replication domain-containing protein n=1 Tax=Salinivibrio sp. IB574 TaxID=1909444 RepID=UPI0009899ADE|nr:phage/plasmid replication protein [Salinivibrio sp. IB574]OOF18885.1 hypothetical protein BZJ17_15850 [Salinivibrio sp. IB574]
MFFIDQLFMQQDYPDGGLPLVGTHVIERVDMETGEHLPPSVNQKVLEGSYSTKLTIRCNGNRVRVEGNPSRWQRMDNLFGLTQLDDCVAIYNHVLAQYGLPPFTKNTKLKHRQSLQDVENAMKTLHATHDEHQSIAHQLLDSGAVNTLRQANTTMSYFTMWQHGTDLRDILKASQFYEHKARLKLIGIDISRPFDVSRMCPTLKRSEVIEVKPLSIPSWYQLPRVATTNVLPFHAYAS